MFGIAKVRANRGRFTYAAWLSAWGIGAALVAAVVIMIQLRIPVKRAIAHLDYMEASRNYEASTPILTAELPRGNRALMELDTGTDESLISDELASRLCLRPQPRRRLDDTSPLKDAGRAYVTLPFVRLGGVVVAKLRCRVVPMQTLEASGLIATDGVLGADFLHHSAVAFDFQNRQITIWRPGGLSRRDLDTAGFRGADSLPFLRSRGSDRPRVECTLGVRKIKAMLDTGGDSGAVLASVARELGLKTSKQIEPLSSLYGQLSSRDAAATLTIGHSILRSQAFSCIVSSPVPWEPEPSLGIQTLKHFQLLLDFDAGRAYFKRALISADTPPGPIGSITMPLAMLENRRTPAVVGILSDGRAHLFGIDLGRIETTILSAAALRAHLKTSAAGASLHCASSFKSLCGYPHTPVSMKLVGSDAELQTYPELEGCLGSDFFESRKLVVGPAPGDIDFLTQDCADLIRRGDEIRWTRIPLVKEHGRWYVTGRMDGELSRLQLDSLSQRSVIYARRGRSDRPRRGPAHTVSGPPRGLRIGGAKCENPLIVTIPNGRPGPDNILNPVELSSNPVMIDYMQRAMYVGIFRTFESKRPASKAHLPSGRTAAAR